MTRYIPFHPPLLAFVQDHIGLEWSREDFTARKTHQVSANSELGGRPSQLPPGQLAFGHMVKTQLGMLASCIRVCRCRSQLVCLPAVFTLSWVNSCYPCGRLGLSLLGCRLYLSSVMFQTSEKGMGEWVLYLKNKPTPLSTNHNSPICLALQCCHC